MTPVTPGKRGAVKRRWPADDNQTDSEEAQQTMAACKRCGIRVTCKFAVHMTVHCARHLNLRPFNCDGCPYVAKLKSDVSQHMRNVHQGNGQVIDNRTVEYFDALEAETIANFPGHRVAITKYMEGQRPVSGIQDNFDHDNGNQHDNPPMADIMASAEQENVPRRTEVSPSIPGTALIKQEWELIAEPPANKKKADILASAEQENVPRRTEVPPAIPATALIKQEWELIAEPPVNKKKAAPTLPLPREVKQEVLENDRTDKGVVDAAISIAHHVKQNPPIDQNLGLGENSTKAAAEVTDVLQPPNKDRQLERDPLAGIKSDLAEINKFSARVSAGLELFDRLSELNKDEKEHRLMQENAQLRRENRLLIAQVAALQNELRIEEDQRAASTSRQ